MQHPTAPSPQPAKPRGPYAQARADFTLEQAHDAYTDDEHCVWAELLARQLGLLARYAVPEFRAGVESLALGPQIPRFAAISARLRNLTGWEIVAVPGLIPERQFFDHLAQRRFPVTVWIRRRDEFDYLAEPDLFHDFFGHIPLLADPDYANFIELYGKAGQRALANDGLQMLARLYWYGVEFGLMETAQGLKSYGAGILSSFGETQYAIDSPVPHRLRFDLTRVLRSDYVIDEFQRNYFVIRSFRELIDAAVQTDFLPLYRAFSAVPGIPVGTLLAGDEVLHRGIAASK